MTLRLTPALVTVKNVALGLVFAAGLVMAIGPAARADEKNSATVSFLDGKAKVVPGGNGAGKDLKKDAKVFEGDVVETAKLTKLELKLGDGSVVRLGPESKLQLNAAHFGEKGDKSFSAKLFFGRVWSKVTGLVDGESKFEVETDNAVAGVRGTTFRVNAERDKSVLVRVYAGAVAMAPGAAVRTKKAEDKKPGERRQVAGPRQVTKKEWEILVGKMMQMSVAADGTPGKAEEFTAEADAKDEWAEWNKMRDGE